MSVTIDGTLGITSPAETTTNLAYTGTLTGGTGIVNLGTGQVYKDAAGNVGIGVNPSGYGAVGTITPIHLNFVNFYSATDTCPYQGLGIYLLNASATESYGFGVASGSAITYRAGSTSSGQHIFVTSNTERMRIDAAGSLILAGSTAQKATGTTWSNPSDIRLKDKVTNYTKGLNELMQVAVKEWEYNGKGGTSKGLKGLGVIADEVMLVLPNTVENYKAKLNEDDADDSDIKKFDATEITWLMLTSIQELKAIIDTQQARIEALEARV